jgi:SAM-dependent methyltransferase
MQTPWLPFDLTEEQQNTEGLRLHLACGSIYLNNWINVDLANDTADIACDVSKLDHFSDNSADLILASHVIEHFPQEKIIPVLKEWRRVIKPKYWVIVECPDFQSDIENFLTIPRENISQRIAQFPQIFGRPDWHPLQTHLCGIWHEFLEYAMREAGFTEMIRRPAKADDIQHLCMRIDCRYA